MSSLSPPTGNNSTNDKLSNKSFEFKQPSRFVTCHPYLAFLRETLPNVYRCGKELIGVEYKI